MKKYIYRLKRQKYKKTKYMAYCVNIVNWMKGICICIVLYLLKCVLWWKSNLTGLGFAANHLRSIFHNILFSRNYFFQGINIVINSHQTNTLPWCQYFVKDQSTPSKVNQHISVRNFQIFNDETEK